MIPMRFPVRRGAMHRFTLLGSQTEQSRQVRRILGGSVGHPDWQIVGLRVWPVPYPPDDRGDRRPKTGIHEGRYVLPALVLPSR